jgi:hypothetical protein
VENLPGLHRQVANAIRSDCSRRDLFRCRLWRGLVEAMAGSPSASSDTIAEGHLPGHERRELEEPGAGPKWLALNSIMALFVRSDAIEISSIILPIRTVAGMEYYFKANEIFIETSQVPSPFSKKNWIIITGRHNGKEIRLAITDRTRGNLYGAWNALVGAGAVSIGPPPPPPSLPPGHPPLAMK